MRFDLDEEQLALQELAAQLLADHSPVARLRRAWEGAASDDVWPVLAASGLTGLGIPAALGGSDGSLLEAVVVLEQAGAVALPEPLAPTLGVAVPMLRDAAPEALRSAWLPDIARGSARVGLALDDPLVTEAASTVDAVLLTDGSELHLVAREDLELRPVSSEDPTRDLAQVVSAATSASTRLPGVALAEVRSLAAVATAASLVGLTSRMLDLAVSHARTREQFGTAIGAFQAVQHPLASIHVELEAARPAVWYAALAHRDGGPDRQAAARVAKAAATSAAARADRVVLQVLGGIGFTWEHDFHMLSKRSAAWRALHGDARAHHTALGAARFAGAT